MAASLSVGRHIYGPRRCKIRKHGHEKTDTSAWFVTVPYRQTTRDTIECISESVYKFVKF